MPDHEGTKMQAPCWRNFARTPNPACVCVCVCVSCTQSLVKRAQTKLLVCEVIVTQHCFLQQETKADILRRWQAANGFGPSSCLNFYDYHSFCVCLCVCLEHQHHQGWGGPSNSGSEGQWAAISRTPAIRGGASWTLLHHQEPMQVTLQYLCSSAWQSSGP